MRIVIVLIGILVCACNPVDQQKAHKTSETAIHPVDETGVDCVSIADLDFTRSSGSAISLSDQKPFSGQACSYFPSGRISTLTSFQNGQKHGIWRVYFENGQIEKEGNIEEGKEHGRYYEYFSTGQLKYDYTYERGKKTGVWKSWYESGVRYTERHFNNDQLHGKVFVWDENGKPAKEYDYDRGILVNSIMHFKNEN